MSRTLAYACSLLPEIADDITAVDRAMRLGYNWKWGPFELLDRIGPAWFAARLEGDGVAVPRLLRTVGEKTFYRVEDGRLQYLTLDGGYADVVRPEGVLLLEDVKRQRRPVARNGSASLWDIGDRVACLEFHSKMNALDGDTLDLIDKAIGIVAKDFEALVIYNEGSNFSVGANIGLALFAANVAVWPMVEDLVAKGQKIYRKLRGAPFPVVAAPSGMALGGGCEVCLNADAIQAHAETYIGLVEVGVGVIPAWTGSTELLTRSVRQATRRAGRCRRSSRRSRPSAWPRSRTPRSRRKELLFLRAGDAHHDEPRPPARRRQGHGAGARRGLPAARDGADRAARPERPVGARDGGRRPPPEGRRDARTTGWCAKQLGLGPLGRRRGGHHRSRSPDKDLLELERVAFIALVRRARDPRPHGAHARHRPAAQELTMPPTYRAPVEDVAFLLRDLLDYDGTIATLPGFEDATWT